MACTPTGDKCAGYLADTISVGNNALGCSNLMQALSRAYSVAYSNDRGSAFASIISGLSTLVATVRACLSPQQVWRVLKGMARGGDSRRDAVRHTCSTSYTFAPASPTCPPPLPA